MIKLGVIVLLGIVGLCLILAAAIYYSEMPERCPHCKSLMGEHMNLCPRCGRDL